MKVGDEVKLEVTGEICCDECNDIWHNHMDCPVCKVSDAGTDVYHDLYHHSDVLECEECGAVLEKIAGDWYSSDCMVRIVSLGKITENENKSGN